MCESRYSIEKLEPGHNIHHLSTWQKFCNSEFPCEIRDFVIIEDMIHSVDSATGQHLQCSVIGSLGSTDLN